MLKQRIRLMMAKGVILGVLVISATLLLGVLVGAWYVGVRTLETFTNAIGPVAGLALLIGPTVYLLATGHFRKRNGA